MKTIAIDCLLNFPEIYENNEIIYEHPWCDDVSYFPCTVVSEQFIEDGIACVKITES